MTTIDVLWYAVYFLWAMGMAWLLVALLWVFAFWHSDRKEAIAVSIVGGLVALLMFYYGFATRPEVFVRQIAPGVYIGQPSKLVAIETIPMDKGLPVIYQTSTFNGAGLVSQHRKWYFVVFLTEEGDCWPSKDLAVHQDDAWRVFLTRDVKSQLAGLPTATKHVQADCWWKHDHPDKQVQAEMNLLVWPTNKVDKPRIEKWVFDS